MIDFQFADLHCHPTLKTFGHSFSKKRNSKCANMWYSKPPTVFSRWFQKLSGITRFSQADLTAMINGGVKIAFVSLYPFEKGFFKHPYFNRRIVAMISSFITSIGYKRVRYIQSHSDYFTDLMNEYKFLLQSPRKQKMNGLDLDFSIVNSFDEVVKNLNNVNHLSVIPTIEGAHVFNSGLRAFGKVYAEDEIIKNINTIKNLKHPPLFITFAHNFNNELCGHAPSLECLGSAVDQSENLNAGFSKLGLKAIHQLLNDEEGAPIYIDIKHMSLKSRLQYYNLLKTDFTKQIPVIVSHGAVAGRPVLGKSVSSLNSSFFANDSINFYDEELVVIAKSQGLFAIQLDSKRLAPKHLIKKPLFNNNKSNNLKYSVLLVWRQLQHVAEVLDSNNLFAWGTCCLGSDFDGTINPLNEIWTASDLNELANELVMLADEYITSPNALKQFKNKNISAETIVENFTIQNTLNFVGKFYSKPKSTI